MPGFSILLAPSEGKVAGGNPLAPSMFDRRASDTFNYFSTLNPERRQVIAALKAAIEDGVEADLEELFGVKGRHLEEAIEANLSVMDSPRMAAMDRYSPGVMYAAIDFANLPTGAQRRLLENGIIFSGLYGLLRPDDLIQNYRLRMDATLPGIGKVAAFWRPYISSILNDLLDGRFVWNLLPGTHQEAWDDQHRYRSMVEVKFFVEENGERKPVTHSVKVLRGALIRFIVREQADSLDLLVAEGPINGFVYDEEASVFDDATRTGTVVMVKR